MLGSLEIKNFRSLANFQVPKLGRVNLIVGKNNSGKSSVLEALRIYAGNAHRGLLEEIAAGHDEKYRLREGERDDPDTALPFADLFTGRRFPDDDDTIILIGESAGSDQALRIRHALLVETAETVTDEAGETSTRIRRRPVAKKSLSQLADELVAQALVLTKGERSSLISLESTSPRFRNAPLEISGHIPCGVVPTQFVSVDELAAEWDKIVFTEHEDAVRKALRIIAPEFENLAFVRNDDAYSTNAGRGVFRRFAKVKMSDSPHPVPLNSLGDGMLRVLQLVLKVFPAKGGILLIDEFENGLHYSVQEKVWALLFELAQKLDIQIFATTHSWDCIESFAQTALARQDVDGLLFRVGKSARTSDHGRIIATVFDEADLHGITQADVEVR